MTPEPTAASPADNATSSAQNTAQSTAPAAAPNTTAAPTGVVRRATVEDAAEAAWLAALTFPLACPPQASRSEMATHIAEKLTPAQFRAWAASDEHALLVYDDGTQLLGYALLVLGSPAGAAEADAVRAASGRDAPYVELSKIYVQPDAQGGGVAGDLMRAASDTAAELGAGLPFWLATNEQNLRAQAFYRKSGFEVVGKRTYVVGGLAHDDVVLLRNR
ncbi:GNAT family N-acetyltransferase [Promicromonospora panici]|uniref:GNAT family N-acetyltransferase n=1 Tax=Promicromonospora panici TaxID=2219658 RepID=UPI001F5D6204|nr:GNAT family N-acetyltransferase [Promicromonospora panici]